jgi:hypothetical protein
MQVAADFGYADKDVIRPVAFGGPIFFWQQVHCGGSGLRVSVGYLRRSNG